MYSVDPVICDKLLFYCLNELLIDAYYEIPELLKPYIIEHL